jgi:hypothetical protein
MSNALELHITPVARSVVKEKNRAGAINKEVFEGQDLPSKAKRIMCEKPKFRKRIKHNARRFKRLDPVQDVLRGVLKLDFRRMEVRVLIVGLEALLSRSEFVDLYTFERPSMRLGTTFELSL